MAVEGGPLIQHLRRMGGAHRMILGERPAAEADTRSSIELYDHWDRKVAVRYVIHYRGVAIAKVEAPSVAHLGSVILELLPAFDTLKTHLPSLWQYTGPRPEPQAVPRTIADPDIGVALELRDETGVWIPTTSIEMWMTGPSTAAAVIRAGEAPAAVAAPKTLGPRQASSAVPEV